VKNTMHTAMCTCEHIGRSLPIPIHIHIHMNKRYDEPSLHKDGNMYRHVQQLRLCKSTHVQVFVKYVDGSRIHSATYIMPDFKCARDSLHCSSPLHLGPSGLPLSRHLA